MSPERLKRLRQEAADLFPAYPVALAYLYGSEATGTATPLSDVDIAVLADPGLSPREHLRVALAVEDALATTFERQVDVRTLNDAPLAMQAVVVQSGVPIYARDAATRVDFEAGVRQRYFDFLPVIRLHREAYFRRQRRILEKEGLP